MKIVDKVEIVRIAQPQKKSVIKIGASTSKKLENKTMSRQSEIKGKIAESKGYKDHIGMMGKRTFETIDRFIKYACTQQSQALWTTPPKLTQLALSTGFASFNLKWDQIKAGCKWFMKIPDVSTAQPAVQTKIKRSIYLTLAALLQDEMIIKPYGDFGDEGSVRAATFDPNGAHTDANADHFKLFLHNFGWKAFKGTVLKEEYAIHISEANLEHRASTNAVITLIHEGSHKYAGTDDNGYLYSRDEEVSKMSGNLKIGGYMARSLQQYQIKINPDNDFNTATIDSLIWNADSIAALIYHYGN